MPSTGQSLMESSGVSASPMAIRSTGSDGCGQPLAFNLVPDSGPEHAQAFTLAPNGQVTYTPDNGYEGLDNFDFTVTSCGGNATVNSSPTTASPALTVPSLTLDLNPTGGGTWIYTCEESSDYGASYHPYGPQGQNTLVVATDDGAKSYYRYRMTAQQGITTATVTASPWPSSAVARGAS